MDSSTILDDESLGRAFFCPEHHNGETFLNTAVSLEDLKDRGFSVDRPPLTPLSVLLYRLRKQRNSNPSIRQSAKFSELFCEKIKAEINEDTKAPLFEVKASPVDSINGSPANPGHASIYSADRSLGRGDLRKLRTKLIDHLNNVVPLEVLNYVMDVDPSEFSDTGQ